MEDFTGIIESLRSGNAKSLEELYNKYSSSLMAFAYSFVHDKNICEDIIQDSFIAIWQQRSGLTDDTNLRNYIYTIVRNKSISAIRSMIKERSVSFGELTARDHFLNRKLMSLEQMESSLIDIDSIKRDIESIYNSLPPIYKDVFTLSRYQNRSNVEIAVILGISVKTVEKRMTKTLKIFKNTLKDNFILLNLL